MKPTREHEGEIVDYDDLPSGKRVVKVIIATGDLPIPGETIRLVEFQPSEE